MAPGGVAGRALAWLAADAGAKPRENVGHLEPRAGRVGALVAPFPAGTGKGLLPRLAGQHPEGDRDARLERRQLEAARRLRRDVLEMRRLAADHAAERDYAGVAP